MSLVQPLRNSLVKSLLLVLAVLGLSNVAQAEQSNPVHGVASADWEKRPIAEPFPYNNGDSDGTGDNQWDWWINNTGRNGVGSALARDEGAGSYTERHKSQLVYVEEWDYRGDLVGHLEGSATLNVDASVSLTRETDTTDGDAAGQAAPGAHYWSNTAGGPHSVVIDDVAAETTASSMATFTFTWGPFSITWSTTINSSGWGSYSDNKGDIVPETECADEWTMKSKIDIGVEVFVDSYQSGKWVQAMSDCTASVDGTITLSELPPQDCP